MTWLLKLYPPRWRRRYGRELAELVGAQPFSIGAAVDLIAGAIDAWLHPQLVAPDTKGDATMIGKMMQLKCAGFGPDVTANDRGKSVAVMIGGTFVLSLLWLLAQRQVGKNDYLLAVLPMTYFLPYLLGLRYTSLKGRSARAQTILIVGLGVALSAFCLLAAWVGTKI